MTITRFPANAEVVSDLLKNSQVLKFMLEQTNNCYKHKAYSTYFPSNFYPTTNLQN